MNLPNEVPHGLPVSDLTQAVNQLIRYVRSITPRPSASVAVETLSNGTTFRVKPASPGGAATVPKLYLDNSAFIATAVLVDEDSFDVTVLGGTAQWLFGPIAEFATETYEDIPGGERFWLQFDPLGNGGDGEWAIEHDETLPSESTTDDGLNYFTVVPLFKVEGGVPRNVVQYHFGSVYVPKVHNVVQAQDTATEEEGGAGGGE